MDQYLELKNVVKEHNLGSVQLKSLYNVNMVIEKKGFHTLIGPEASGKSRILYILGFMDHPSQGKFFLEGKNVADLTDKEINRIRTKDIGFVPQIHHLNNTVSVLDNVSMVIKILGEEHWQADEKAEAILNKIGFKKPVDCLPLELNLKEIKMVALAKALIKKPQILIADDPYYQLATEDALALSEVFKTLKKEKELTFLQAVREETFALDYDICYEVQEGVTKLKHRQKSFNAA
ncbi:MAG: ATP-binding cassette domain-containing protein [Candidatus Cyclobacteriaceae bacterium M3_2C_046]